MVEDGLRFDPGVVKEADCRGWLRYNLLDADMYRERPPKNERHGDDSELTASIRKRAERRNATRKKVNCKGDVVGIA